MKKTHILEQQQRDYIYQFVERIDSILEAMLSRECIKDTEWKCGHCDADNWAVWRCTDCLLSQPMCRQCIRTRHLDEPFHKIEQWTGTYFRPTSLRQVGVYILVRHCDGPPVCESLKFYRDALEDAERHTDSQEQFRLGELFTKASQVESPSGPQCWQTPIVDAEDRTNADYDYLEAERQSDAAFESFLDNLRESPDAEIQEPDDYEELADVDEEAETSPSYLPEI